MKKIPLALVLSLLSNLLFSQSFVLPGFLVLNNGDTLNGYVHDKQWTRNPRFVEFQLTRESEVKKYPIEEVVAFSSIRPSLYMRQEVSYDGSRQENELLSESALPIELTKETILLKSIIQSKISLLQSIDISGRVHYFIQQGNDLPHELLNRKFKGKTNGVSVIRTFEGWKQELILLTQKCPDLHSKIKFAQYDERSLRKLFEDINRCLGVEVNKSNVSRLARKKPEIGIVAQAFKGQTEIVYIISPMSKVNFGFGASFELFSKNRPERRSFYNEIRFKSISQRAQSYAQSPLVVKASSVRLVNMIRFSYPIKSNYIFWNLGLTNGYRFDTDLAFDSGRNFDIDYNEGIENGIVAGIGTKMKVAGAVKASMQILYELENGPFSKSDFIGSHNIGIILGIHF